MTHVIEFVSFEQTDEREYTLILVGENFRGLDEEARITMSQGTATELWVALDRTIGEHMREGDLVRAEYDRARGAGSLTFDEARDAYPSDSPKHPDYHERVAAGADLARKQAKGE